MFPLFVCQYFTITSFHITAACYDKTIEGKEEDFNAKISHERLYFEQLTYTTPGPPKIIVRTAQIQINHPL
jgi:hypothetical protein